MHAEKGSADFVALKPTRSFKVLSCDFLRFKHRGVLEEDTMICFQVEINGKKLCTAGVGEFGVLTTVLSLVRNRQQGHSIDEDTAKVQLRVGGTTSLKDSVDESVEWTSSSLNVGDEVRVTVTDQLQPDDPTERTRRDPALELERTKAHYEWLISELEKEIEARDRTTPKWRTKHRLRQWLAWPFS